MFPTGNVLDNLAEQAEGSTWTHFGKSAQLYTSWEHARSSAHLLDFGSTFFQGQTDGSV